MWRLAGFGSVLLMLVVMFVRLGGQVRSPLINSNAAAAYESLLRLRTTATVLHTTAHPDDEDGPLITWLARAQGVRTGLLTLTRGEGGEDLAGPELHDGLGLVRTEELLSAGRYYGVDQFFTRAVDFGFSKRLDETLSRWNKDAVLGDCVRVVRLYRPDVIVSRFSGTPRDGHGNHQAAGVLSLEVFAAAADPKRFPEHFSEGLRPWQVKKLYCSARPEDTAATKIDTGVYDSLIGMSYRQLAAEGLAMQRSQGEGGRRAEPGPAISAITLSRSALKAKQTDAGMFDGIDTSLRGLAKIAPSLNLDEPLGEVEKDVSRAIEEFDARDPSRVLEAHVAPALRNLRTLIRDVSDAPIDQDAKYDLLFRLRNKEDEFMHAGNLLAGIAFEAQADAPGAVATPGEKFGVDATFTNRSNVKMESVELGLSVRGALAFTSTPSQRDSLGHNEQLKQRFEVNVGPDAEYTRPYWSRKDEYRDPMYQIDQPQYRNLPYAPPEIVTTATYRIDGVRFTASQPAQVGADRQVLMIAPALSVSIEPRIGVLAATRRPTIVDIHAPVLCNVNDAETKVRLELPAGWTANPPEALLHFTHTGEVQIADFRLMAPLIAAGKNYTIAAIAEHDGREYRDGYEAVSHRGLEARPLYRRAIAEMAGVDVKVAPNLKVGYIMGAGDEVPRALEQMGVKTQMLSPADLASANLAPFDAIVVGTRASAVRDDYRAYNRRLLDYVRGGGHLIVQFQTQEFDALPYGPFRYKLGTHPEEVSEEGAKVTILDPANPVLNVPNKITAADFDGWVEERGSKFMSEWDAQYKPLLECHDRDQAPQKGGLLVAHYGKGTFTYAAYSFYRQLPVGVPGAYRLIANLISSGKFRQQ